MVNKMKNNKKGREGAVVPTPALTELTPVLPGPTGLTGLSFLGCK